KVIIPVDIAGIICDYEKIYEIVESKKGMFEANNDIQKLFSRIIIMADSAHGFGSESNHLQSGNIADFTCFSFHAVKNLTTAEGGAVTWKSKIGLNDDEIYKLYQLLSLHGQTKDALHKNQLGSWEYDILIPAYKCNMTDVMAAIGLIQLDRYKDMLNWRHEIIKMYNEAFEKLPISVLNHADSNHRSSGHLYFVHLNDNDMEKRNQIIEEMARKGIACNVHYKPLPMLTAYKNLGFDINDYPNAYEQYKGEITLPLYSTLSKEDVEYIIKSFQECLKEFE
ncbi:MAG: DegT/DnrJ/EryC1/StrS family aminotransferase, partial [Coprobacillus sp.]